MESPGNAPGAATSSVELLGKIAVACSFCGLIGGTVLLVIGEAGGPPDTLTDGFKVLAVAIVVLLVGLLVMKAGQARSRGASG